MIVLRDAPSRSQRDSFDVITQLSLEVSFPFNDAQDMKQLDEPVASVKTMHALTEKQKGVVRGVVPAAALTAVGLCGATLLVPPRALPVDEPGARLAWALQWSLPPTLTLMVAIMRVANHRFYTPEDIDGSGLTGGTARVQILRAVLQNTLEQTLLASAAYAIWAVTMPHAWLRAVCIASLLFVAGRVLFSRGYQKGAAARAMGFGLTAYPTFVMLVTAALTIMFRLAIGIIQ